MWIPKPFNIRPFSIALVLAWLAAPAGAATITVLSPASTAPGAQALATLFTQATGTPVTVTGSGRDKIFSILKAGGPADVVLLPSADFAELPSVTAMTPLGHV